MKFAAKVEWNCSQLHKTSQEELIAAVAEYFILSQFVRLKWSQIFFKCINCILTNVANELKIYYSTKSSTYNHISRKYQTLLTKIKGIESTGKSENILSGILELVEQFDIHVYQVTSRYLSVYSSYRLHGRMDRQTVTRIQLA